MYPRGQVMPPVATVTGWGRMGPEEDAPMSRQLLVTQVTLIMLLMYVYLYLMFRFPCSALRSARHSQAPVSLTMTRSVAKLFVSSLYL